jgi:hypothetical protein
MIITQSAFFMDIFASLNPSGNNSPYNTTAGRMTPLQPGNSHKHGDSELATAILNF